MAMSFEEQFGGRLPQELDDTVEPFAVQFPADFPVEAFGGAVGRR